MGKLHLRLAALACAAALPGLASAFTIFDEFGAFPDATFGGTGIPNDAVAASRQFIDGENIITVAMNATGRFSNPQLSNNGAGVYFAGPGSNFGGNGESTSEGALWNWNYYIDISNVDPNLAPTKVLADYQIDLWYDFDPDGPRICCDLTGSGRIDLTQSLLFSLPGTGGPGSTLEEGSQNLLFSFLATDSAPFLFAPRGAFDSSALGNYQFAITVSTGGIINFPVEAVAMEVQVVPVPAAVWLFGSALGLLAWVRRRIDT